jgi:hypothetical protein
MDPELLLNIVIQTIRNEPEFPTQPPQSMIDRMNNIINTKDTKAFTQLLRTTVAITKKSIEENLFNQILLTNRQYGSC